MLDQNNTCTNRSYVGRESNNPYCGTVSGSVLLLLYPKLDFSSNRMRVAASFFDVDITARNTQPLHHQQAYCFTTVLFASLLHR